MAIKDAPIVEIPQVDEAAAYDHNRPISSLIRTQLLHLHHAEQLAIPPDKQTNTNINHLLTELQASEYIAAVTALLHKYGKAKTSAKGSAKPKKKVSAKSRPKPSQKKAHSAAISRKKGKTSSKKITSSRKKR